MKTQEHNQGELKEITVEIEKKLAEDLQTMSENSGLSTSDLVTIAVKRFRSAHADYMGHKVDFP